MKNLPPPNKHNGHKVFLSECNKGQHRGVIWCEECNQHVAWAKLWQVELYHDRIKKPIVLRQFKKIVERDGPRYQLRQSKVKEIKDMYARFDRNAKKLDI